MILAGTRATFELTVYQDGTATDPASAGTVTVTDADGNVVSSGAAVLAGGSSGKLRYTATAAELAEPNQLTITWADVVIGADPAVTLTTTEEVVGELLFTEAEARAYDNGALENAAVYSDDDIRRGHDSIADAFGKILQYPLGLRYFQETLDGNGAWKLRLERGQVRAVRRIATRAAGTATWTAFTAEELAAVQVTRWGQMVRETGGDFPVGIQNVRVSYVAGKAIAGELRTAALRVLRHWLVPSNLPDRALFQTNEIGQFRLAVAGEGARWFGIPEVDAVLLRHREVRVW